MRWPHGRYNGRRIVGIAIRMEIDILTWWWGVRCQHGTLAIFMGPVHIWVDANYETLPF